MKAEKPPLPPKPELPVVGDCYHHHTEGLEPRLYVVQGFVWPAGVSSTKIEWHVRYRCVKGDAVGEEFVRPVSEFVGTVLTEDNTVVPRYIRDERFNTGLDEIDSLEVMRARARGEAVVGVDARDPAPLSDPITVHAREHDVRGEPSFRHHYVRIVPLALQYEPASRKFSTTMVSGALRQPLMEFALRMEHQLAKKDPKRGQLGWRDSTCHLANLFSMAGSKLRALNSVASLGELPTDPVAFEAWQFDCAHKAADVANLVMMIADRVLLEKPQEPALDAGPADRSATV